MTSHDVIQLVDLSFFVTNLTKQVIYTLIQPLYGSFGFDVRYLGQPRMLGARSRCGSAEITELVPSSRTRGRREAETCRFWLFGH